MTFDDWSANATEATSTVKCRKLDLGASEKPVGLNRRRAKLPVSPPGATQSRYPDVGNIAVPIGRRVP